MVTGVEGEKAPALKLETLLALGLDQRTAENALVNSKVTANLAAVIAEVTTPPLLTCAALLSKIRALVLKLDDACFLEIYVRPVVLYCN
jgi:hypothetical protein